MRNLIAVLMAALHDYDDSDSSKCFAIPGEKPMRFPVSGIDVLEAPGL